MQARKIHTVMRILEEEVGRLGVPIVTEISRKDRDPYRVLISTLLSLRTKDETTRKAAEKILSKAPTPDRMLRLSEESIRTLIYPVGFYKTKATVLKEVCRVRIAPSFCGAEEEGEFTSHLRFQGC